MTPSLSNSETSVLKRLERLEVQNRRLKAAVTALAAVAGLGLLLGQAPRIAKYVDAENFILRDAVGRARASLTTVDTYPLTFRTSF